MVLMLTQTSYIKSFITFETTLKASFQNDLVRFTCDNG